ncbi:hypothetical protein DFQ27_000616 [Actinomortierella ambigua]|uniref:Uncharacterized protein n=1 Tax=Actinomortierella ambigua TaxID=1343610 RepID=A0A9P6QDK3_9FUNG|nr:hypothetical protein DFQ27_000616 [Actinomortierella ambigua]
MLRNIMTDNLLALLCLVDGLGLPYRKPAPLVRTQGLDWTYQPDPKLYDKLRGIKKHHDDYFQGRRDKSTIPLYLFLGGAGTGKSRNAQEFHRSAALCLTEKEDRELRKSVEEAWVFHVSLEDDLSLLAEKETDPIEAIGSRMLLQLLPDKGLRDVIQGYKEPHPMDVLKLVAKKSDVDLRSATVMLVVEGLRTFMTNSANGCKNDSAFYRALTNIVNLAFGDVFLMACCTATVICPIDRASPFVSHRYRVVLPVASLKPPRSFLNGLSKPVFDENDHVIKVLVDDCGGHGRALECLQQVVEEAGEDFNVDSLMNSLYSRLQDLYPEAMSMAPNTIQAMAQAILTRARLRPDEPLPGTTELPGDLTIPGLVRYEQSGGLGSGGYLVAPYIWVWLFSYQPRTDVDPPLQGWRF